MHAATLHRRKAPSILKVAVTNVPPQHFYDHDLETRASAEGTFRKGAKIGVKCRTPATSPGRLLTENPAKGASSHPLMWFIEHNAKTAKQRFPPPSYQGDSRLLMFETTDTFFYHTVVADYLTYLDARKSKPFGSSHDLRAALAAATSLYHLREHLPASHKRSVTEVAERCNDYLLIQDVANVAKHRILTRGEPRLRRAEDIFELLVSVSYEDEAGTYFDADKIVVIRLGNCLEQGNRTFMS